ncbi:MAG: ABC transporter substrate-binding protein [Alphaproteobacteria bacterium]
MNALLPRGLLALVVALAALPAGASDWLEPPFLATRVAEGKLPPVAERLPAAPRVVTPKVTGEYGGDLRIAMSRARDTRMMAVYGYARLVGWNRDYELEPDILERVEVEDGRVFTLHLRPGHRWSDGHPFTAEDFRYWWEDVANDKDLSPFGPPPFMKAAGKLPTFTVVDEATVRYAWTDPNPLFLPALAAARDPYIYRPAHYLKPFHAKYAGREAMEEEAKKRRLRSWAALHNNRDNLYDLDNPDLPTLNPWLNTVRPPAQQFAFVRNPYFHRVDAAGHQLPYLDRVLMGIADGKLIPAKAGAGELDLQARNLFMTHIPFLRQAGGGQRFHTWLWQESLGSHMALFPNLNVADPVWRALFRDVRVRRALSLAIDREEINQVIFYGLGTPAQNTVTDGSPLFRDAYRDAWAAFDPKQAGALLDAAGLDRRDRDGVRLLPDGRRAEIVVETAGEESEQVDVLELIHDSWLDIGIKIHTRPSQREVFRNRIFAGETQMAVWSGVENGIPSPDMDPAEFAPTLQEQYQWPKWGQYRETAGAAGEAIDLPAAASLFDLYQDWKLAGDTAARRAIWEKMLAINAEQVFTIGIVCCTKQPVVVAKGLANVPEKGFWAWDPGAHFGIYLPDTFFWADPAKRK